jgi:acyl phosphate:glycerol-3-phosphate acyltransferase
MTGARWGISVALILLAYLVGSLSPSVFLGKWLKGVDVRKVGSGNAGTTNAFRALGTKLGIAVLLLDLLKGVVPVVIARVVLHDSEPIVLVLVAFATIIGHNYSVFLRGKGGKGVATGAGAALALMPVPMAIVVGIFVVLVFTTRIVSIASIVATIMYPVMAVVWHRALPLIIGACVMAAVVLFAHRKNMKRLWKRQEHPFTFPWNKKKGETPATTSPTDPPKAASGAPDSPPDAV